MYDSIDFMADNLAATHPGGKRGENKEKNQNENRQSLLCTSNDNR
jgi:hypothetical protein